MPSQRERDRNFFLGQRDKHLDQFMAINAKAAFAAATAIIGLILGANRLRHADLTTQQSYSFFAVFGLGLILLLVGNFLLARFHTRKIREFEKLSAECDEGDTKRPSRHYQIIPTTSWTNPFNCVLFGITLCLFAALFLLIAIITEWFSKLDYPSWSIEAWRIWAPTTRDLDVMIVSKSEWTVLDLIEYKNSVRQNCGRTEVLRTDGKKCPSVVRAIDSPCPY